MKQNLRLRRFLFASAFSVLYLVVLFVFHTQDKVDRATLLQACVIVLVLILAFCARVPHGAQSSVSGPEPDRMAVAGVRLHDALRRLSRARYPARLRGVLLRRADVRHASPHGRKLAVLGGVSLLSFALVIGLRYANQHDDGDRCVWTCCSSSSSR